VRAIVRQVGLKVEEDVDLGTSLRARLVNDTIQLTLRIELRYDDVVEPDVGHRVPRGIEDCETRP
jgi:hypothetical protein